MVPASPALVVASSALAEAEGGQLVNRATPAPLIGYDSTRPELIPADALVVFPYGDGDYRWTHEQLARFPNARRRSITVLGDPACGIADVETGDMRPGDVPGYLRDRKAEGGSPGCVYCDRSTVEPVQAIVAKAGILPSEWFIFISTLDGTLITPEQHLGGGVLVACQNEGGPDADYDKSRVWRRSWPIRLAA